MTVDQSPSHNLVLGTFRCLIADLVQQYGGGHPGGAMGMAAMGIALWKYSMRYSPNNPDFFNRDRIVLSNGHTCLFQYVFLHLTGYKHMTMEQLKTYHSTRVDSFCPGHPEIEHPGIELTTGPLGQGIANCVGLAIASKNLASLYNRPDIAVVDNTIYCIVGDACLQEGVALEAISLAGHLGLDNLVVLYDNNEITFDGSVDLTNTEDVNKKMEASNWAVLEVEDGSDNVDGIVDAISKARDIKKPVFINIHTVIGIGALNEGQSSAHGAALGVDNVAQLKRKWGMDPEKHFNVPDQVYQFFAECPARGEQYEAEWNATVAKYTEKYPDAAAEFKRRVAGKLPLDWKSYIPKEYPAEPTPTRKSSGLVMSPLAKAVDTFFNGSADLSPSTFVGWSGKAEFQNPAVQPKAGDKGSYSGRYLHYGIREHGMAAIAAGISAYNKGTYIPVISTFLMFYLYAAPAVRMAALQELQMVCVATHDSIGTGEDGPTHQPIALPAFFRALPNTLFVRPADSEETAGAWEAAVNFTHGPSVISLSRQSLPQLKGLTDRAKVSLGAYVVKPVSQPDLQLFASGSEVHLALEAAEKLETAGIKTRVVSFPSTNLFEKQSSEYKAQILLRGKIPSVIVETYAVNGWERYATAGYSMKTFGKSLPGKDVLEYFGFSANEVATKVEKYYRSVTKESMWTFQDLN
ncbi:hypothetical protein OGAPHI_001378 [Ogataea philodendri]|uniref:Transketolase n=1 Tax=Ogataea philodendri TaxID=1378263 RepID=A0A9P8PC39_9ASCO|nr:uncharacterized protein OGAPHI_001378 [Ogataea philodendri]KAH3669257.1 hypothetical protein OGAPHI_001378 [Ogataea philodendri]